MPAAPAVPMVINAGRSADRAPADTSCPINVTAINDIALDFIIAQILSITRRSYRAIVNVGNPGRVWGTLPGSGSSRHVSPIDPGAL
jgi:hypothetical protein